jgi:creatinine amidohydrolase
MAERPIKVHLGKMTKAEAADVFNRRPVILLPVGSHEDHGPQTPMGDYLVAEKLSELVARRATERGVDTLVAPVLPFGGANFFGAAPGGVALSQNVMRLVLAELMENFLRHGLTRLMFVNGHNGNVEPIHDVTLAVYRERKVLIPSYYFWKPCGAMLRNILGEEQAKRVHGHMADPVTSVVMHLFPDRIRYDLIPAPVQQPEVMGLKVTGYGTVAFGGSEFSVPIEVDEVMPDGVWSCDPRLCSPTTGAALVEQLTELGAGFVLHYASQTA